MSKKSTTGLWVLALVAAVLSCLFAVPMSVSAAGGTMWGVLVLVCLLVFASDMGALINRYFH